MALPEGLFDQPELAAQFAVLGDLLFHQGLQLIAAHVHRQHVTLDHVAFEIGRGFQLGERVTPPLHLLLGYVRADEVATDQRPLNFITLFTGGRNLGQVARQALFADCLLYTSDAADE